MLVMLTGASAKGPEPEARGWALPTDEHGVFETSRPSMLAVSWPITPEAAAQIIATLAVHRGGHVWSAVSAERLTSLEQVLAKGDTMRALHFDLASVAGMGHRYRAWPFIATDADHLYEPAPEENWAASSPKADLADQEEPSVA